MSKYKKLETYEFDGMEKTRLDWCKHFDITLNMLAKRKNALGSYPAALAQVKLEQEQVEEKRHVPRDSLFALAMNALPYKHD